MKHSMTFTKTMKYKYHIIFIFIILFLYLVFQNSIFNSITNSMLNRNKDPCNDYLTDNEYLEHMIPHHQVAIDMSNELLKITKNPIMISFCREIKWKQGYEIQMMEGVMNKLPNEFNDIDKIPTNQNNLKNYNKKTKTYFYNPKLSRATDYYCDPNFFKPNDHESHMKNMKLTNKSYLEHMIPHHQVAIDMSIRLLSYTKNIHMIDLVTTIIREQQSEILIMNGMLKNMNSWDYDSKLF
jgi:uncharacterized protein (DUF305 family)